MNLIMANNYHFIYVAFLIVVAFGVVGLASMDFEDKGSCRMTINGEVQTRQPGSQGYVTSEYCIIINS